MLHRSLGLAASIAVLLASGCQPATPDMQGPPTGKHTLGELVYLVVHYNLERSSTCPAERLAALEADRDSFIATFDHAITQDIVDKFPGLVGGTILPAVDRGDIPAVTDALHDSLALLVSDDFDPDRDTLKALAALQEARTVIDGDHVIALIGAVVADPGLRDRIHALAGLALEHDSVDYVINTLLDLVSRAFSSLGDAPVCGDVYLGDVEETLLRTRGFEPASEMGAPAWAVRVDKHGNPRVRVDPSTGKLKGPFVDANLDGVADVDAQGRPVDAWGQPIAIAPFGSDGARDAAGRALADDGTLLYDYFDAKQTTLSRALQLLHRALAQGIHHNLVAIARAGLGEPEPCPVAPGDTADPTCYRYSPEDNPVADLAFLALEALRDQQFSRLPAALSRLVKQDPVLVEELLVAFGQVLQAGRAMETDLTTDDVLGLVEELLPLLADVFDEGTGTGESTPRVLLDRVHELGQVAHDFPAQIGVLIDYADLQDRECTAGTLPVGTRAVDFSQPRWIGSVDNRSSLEQALELLVEADCGNISDDLLNGPGILPGLNSVVGPIARGLGVDLTLHTGSISYVMVDAAAQLEPDQVCDFIQIVVPMLDWAQSVVRAAAWMFGCSDTAALARDLDALLDLANSGGLDFLVPLAHVFQERNQLPLLFSIFHIVVNDLRKDDDGDPATHSVLRPVLPLLSEAVDTGAVDRVIDLIDVMATLPANDAGDTLGDVAVDAVGAAIRMRTVLTRHGDATNTSLVLEALEPARRLVARVEASTDPLATLTPVLDHVQGYLTDTYVDDNGTADPSDDRTRLRDYNLMPLVDVSLQLLGQVLDLDPSTYQCYVDSLQDGAEEFLTGRTFAAAVRLLVHLEGSASGLALEDWVFELIAPPAGNPRDVYGPLLQVSAEILESDAMNVDAGSLLRYVGAVVDPARGDSRRFIQLVDDLFQNDTDDVILTVVRNLFGPGPDGAAEAPISTLGGVYADVARIRPGNACQPDGELPAFSVADLESLITGLLDFMEDDTYGLGAIYRLIGMRADAPPPTGP